ncbi:MAG: tripartite tricarboxylate transporter substrate binding protein [Pseudomonadota bacterium]
MKKAEEGPAAGGGAHRPQRARMGRRACLASAALCLVPALAGAAGTYPERAITMVVPFAPGGPTDVFARILADRLGQELGQPIIVVNRGGAAGNVGVATAARAPADGYTVLFGTASMAVAPSVYPSLAYDTFKDFQPVALLGSCPALVLVAPDGPSSIGQLVARLKAEPDKYSYATSGYASATHLVTEFFNRKAGVKAFVVPYTGSGPAHQGMVSGLHLYTFETASSAMGLINSGTLKVIGIASARRSAILPDVPTIAEAGIPGVDASTWNMLFVPAHTPVAITQRLNAATNKVLSDPATAKKLQRLVIEVTSDSTPESSAAYMRSEIGRWADIVRITGIKAE